MSGSKAYPASDYKASFGLAMAHCEDPLELTQDGIDFELHADYPNPDVVDNGYSDSGCLVILDEKNLFLAGGTKGSGRAYIYNKDTNLWREVGSMIEPREYHSCGLVPSNSESGYEVIVVGGTSGSQEYVESTEIFSIESETFRPGMCTLCHLINYEDKFE